MTDEARQTLPEMPAGRSRASRSTTARPGFAALAKVRQFPQTPGVYLMKDAAGRVIYVGKAKNLRAGPAATFSRPPPRIAARPTWCSEIADIDYLDGRQRGRRPAGRSPADQGHAAEVQPGTERRQDVSVSGDHHARGFSPRRSSRAQPHERGTKLYGPFASAGSLRGAMQVLQKIFKFRTCTLDIDEGDEKWRWFRPCLLATIDQCTAPCNLRISKEDYRQRHPPAADVPGRQQEAAARRDAARRCRPRPASCSSRRRPGCATRSTCSKRSTSAASWTRTSSPRCSTSIPRRGWPACRRCSSSTNTPRTIEGVDIAHLGGGETVASLVQFIDGLPFKPGYRRFKIRDVAGRRRLRQHPRSRSPAGSSGCTTRRRCFPTCC